MASRRELAYVLLFAIAFGIFMFMRDNSDIMDIVDTMNNDTADEGGTLTRISSIRTSQQSISSESPIRLTASQLSDAYETNEIKADMLYKNKSVSVTGVVESVMTIFGTSFITFVNRNPFFAVQCELMDSELPAAANIRK